MRVLSASFLVQYFCGNMATVKFANYPDGRPAEIKITGPNVDQRIDNSRGEWKPCATHAKDLVRLHIHQSPSSNHARKRAIKTKPALRLYGGA
jgi:hypothetical protein